MAESSHWQLKARWLANGTLAGKQTLMELLDCLCKVMTAEQYSFSWEYAFCFASVFFGELESENSEVFSHLVFFLYRSLLRFFQPVFSARRC
jgi:hypothetical protein